MLGYIASIAVNSRIVLLGACVLPARHQFVDAFLRPAIHRRQYLLRRHGRQPRHIADLRNRSSLPIVWRDHIDGVALQRGTGRLEVVVRDHAQHVVGRVVVGLYPGHDVVAGLDLPLMDMGGMAEAVQVLGDPVRPLPVRAGVADEVSCHVPIPGGLLWAGSCASFRSRDKFFASTNGNAVAALLDTVPPGTWGE
jgi:hypothetical protein